MVPFGVELALELRAHNDCPETRTMVAMMAALLDFYCLVCTSPYDASAAADSCRRFLMLYGSLSDAARREHGDECVLWRIKPKFHMMQEIAEFVAPQYGSPRDFWCYKDEDFVGWI